jgi:hypothetical protein
VAPDTARYGQIQPEARSSFAAVNHDLNRTECEARKKRRRVGMEGSIKWGWIPKELLQHSGGKAVSRRLDFGFSCMLRAV